MIERRKWGRAESSHALGAHGPGRGSVLLLSSIVAVSACGGDDATEPIVGDAARVRIEAIAAADPRVEVVDKGEYDSAGESCEDTYGTYRDADHEGFGLELRHRAASDEEVEMLVGIVARTAAFCPEFAAEVGESASRALSRVQLGNPDPFTSQHLDEDLGAYLDAWVDGVTAPVRCEVRPDAFTRASEADMLCPPDGGSRPPVGVSTDAAGHVAAMAGLRCPSASGPEAGVETW